MARDRLTAATDIISVEISNPVITRAGPCPDGLSTCKVSPWSKVNYVDRSLTDQSSPLLFIEDNWGLDYIDGADKRDSERCLHVYPIQC
jgi:hypothetical protein